MKTSNKLLLGLFLFILLGMIIANFFLKSKIENSSTVNNLEIISTTDSLSIINDSIDMDVAISNE
ncbi:MAG: hypothetical protein ACOYMD_04700 [Paludibacter sp.]